MTQTQKSPLTVVLTVVLGMLMAGIDLTIVTVALAQVARDTGASLAAVQWVTTGYSLALAVVIPTTGWAMNRFGARAVFLAAVGVFTVASVCVSASWNIESLAVFRVLQGVGGGLVMPSAMALTLSAAPQEQRGRMMALMTLPAFVAPVFGPVLGGWLLDTWSWRLMFLINVPIGALSIVFGLRNLPVVPRGPVPRLDVRGIALLSPAMALLILGSTAASGEDSADAIVAAGLGVALIAAFIWHAMRSESPLLDLRLLQRKLTAAGTGVLFLFQGGFAASMILMPLYWQLVRGESATTAGLLIVPAGLTVAVMLQLAGRLIDRFPPVAVIGPGITLSAAAAAALAVQLTADAPVWRLVLTTVMLNAGAALTLMPTMTVATRSLLGPDIPSGSTLISVVSQLSVSIGIAIFSVVLGRELAERTSLTADGGLDAVPSSELPRVAPALAEAFSAAFWLPVTLMSVAAVVAWVAFVRAPGPRPTTESPASLEAAAG